MSSAHDQDQTQSKDTHLIANVRAGDKRAFEEIYTTHARDLISFARSYLPVATAEDLVQDVFVSLWERRDKIKLNGSLRAYLFGAVKRKARDVKRHELVQDKTAAMNPDTSPGMGTSPQSPEAAATYSALNQAVDEFLATLNEDHRILLTLRWSYGMTYEEAAEVLGISANAAKKQGQRLDQKLRPMFEKFR